MSVFYKRIAVVFALVVSVMLFAVSAYTDNRDALSVLIYGEDTVNGYDYENALQVLTPLAEQGNSYAQWIVGRIYESGKGAPQDFSQAIKWYRRAAAQGNRDAQTGLGMMYTLGETVPQDYIDAHMWFALAADNGGKDAAQARDRLAEQMTQTQIIKAQKRARDCLTKNYQDC